jgi:transposase
MQHCTGIDLHKKTSQITVLDPETDRVVLRQSIRTWPKRFQAVLDPFAPARILLEASTVSRWAAPFLRSRGHEVIVGDPNYALMYASRPPGCKNDQTDADALAVACKHRHFKAIYEPNAEQQPIAELLGTRTTEVRRRTAAINRVRALYLAHGIELGGGEADTFWARVKARPAGERIPAAEPLLNELAMLEDLVSASERELEQLAESHEVAKLLMTVPGVGPIVALSFYVKIGDPTRFRTAHQVESYLGLVAKIHASAEPGQGIGITKRGSRELRRLLVQAAWSHVGSSDARAQPIREWFLRMEQRRPTGVAITAVARRLTGLLWAMWREKKPFELREPRPTSSDAAKAPRARVRRYQMKSSRSAAEG